MNRLFLVATVTVSICLSARAGVHITDSPAEVKKAVDDGKAILIDVREPAEWKEGHLQGASNLPLSDLKAGVPAEKLKELFPTGKIIYVHCAAGVRSLKAADLLKSSGYEVRPLKPGYDDLLKMGFPKAK